MAKWLGYLILSLSYFLESPLFAAQGLKEKIIERTENFDDLVGIYIHHMNTGEIIEIHSESF